MSELTNKLVNSMKNNTFEDLKDDLTYLRAISSKHTIKDDAHTTIKNNEQHQTTKIEKTEEDLIDELDPYIINKPNVNITEEVNQAIIDNTVFTHRAIYQVYFNFETQTLNIYNYVDTIEVDKLKDLIKTLLDLKLLNSYYEKDDATYEPNIDTCNKQIFDYLLKNNLVPLGSLYKTNLVAKTVRSTPKQSDIVASEIDQIADLELQQELKGV